MVQVPFLTVQTIKEINWVHLRFLIYFPIFVSRVVSNTTSTQTQGLPARHYDLPVCCNGLESTSESIRLAKSRKEMKIRKWRALRGTWKYPTIVWRVVLSSFCVFSSLARSFTLQHLVSLARILLNTSSFYDVLMHCLFRQFAGELCLWRYCITAHKRRGE